MVLFMLKTSIWTFVLCFHALTSVYATAGSQVPIGTFSGTIATKDQTWLEKYGPQIDQPFSGPLAFSHLPYHRCLEDESIGFDIAVLGMPFDTGVTYRSG